MSGGAYRAAHLKVMTVQIDIDEKILAEVDHNLKVLHQNRDDFFRQGIIDLAAKLRREAGVAAQYRAAYSKQPQTDEEVDEWADVQDWSN